MTPTVGYIRREIRGKRTKRNDAHHYVANQGEETAEGGEGIFFWFVVDGISNKGKLENKQREITGKGRKRTKSRQKGGRP